MKRFFRFIKEKFNLLSLRQKVTGLSVILVMVIAGALVFHQIVGADENAKNGSYNLENHSDIRIEISNSVATRDQLKRIWQGEQSSELIKVKEKIDRKQQTALDTWAKGRYDSNNVIKQPTTPTQTPQLTSQKSLTTNAFQSQADFIVTYTEGGVPVDFQSGSQSNSSATLLPAQDKTFFSGISKALAQDNTSDCLTKYKVCLEFSDTEKDKWTSDEKKNILDVYNKSYDTMVEVNGEPREEMTGEKFPTLKIEKVDQARINGIKVVGYYLQSINTIVLSDAYVGNMQVFLHEIIHAFHALCLNNPAWDEGTTEAETRIIINKVYNTNISNYAETIYDFLNTEYIETNYFHSNDTIGEYNRYSMSAAAFERLYYATNGGFFKKFNEKAITVNRALSSDSAGSINLSYTRNDPVTAARQSIVELTGKDIVEGISFNKWYGKQYVFQSVFQAGKTYVYSNDSNNICAIKKQKSEDGRNNIQVKASGNLLVNASPYNDSSTNDKRDGKGCVSTLSADAKRLAIFRDESGKIQATRFFLYYPDDIKSSINPHVGGYVTQDLSNGKIIVQNEPKRNISQEIPLQKDIYSGGSNISPGSYSLIFSQGNNKMESSRKYWTLGANYSTALYIQNDFQPPTISQPTTNYIPTSNHSMQILWNTDEATASTIEYAKQGDDVVKGEIFWADSSQDISSHQFNLNNLSPGTTYTYRITVVDKAGYIAQLTKTFKMEGGSPDTGGPIGKEVNVTSLPVLTCPQDEKTTAKMKFDLMLTPVKKGSLGKATLNLTYGIRGIDTDTKYDLSSPEGKNYYAYMLNVKQKSFNLNFVTDNQNTAARVDVDLSQLPDLVGNDNYFYIGDINFASGDTAHIQGWFITCVFGKFVPSHNQNMGESMPAQLTFDKAPNSLSFPYESKDTHMKFENARMALCGDEFFNYDCVFTSDAGLPPNPPSGSTGYKPSSASASNLTASLLGSATGYIDSGQMVPVWRMRWDFDTATLKRSYPWAFEDISLPTVPPYIFWNTSINFRWHFLVYHPAAQPPANNNNNNTQN